MVSAELTLGVPASLKALGGNGYFPRVIIRASKAMRSVCRMQGDFGDLEGITFDANFLADYAVLEDSFRHSTLRVVGYHHAVLDNVHRVQYDTQNARQANNDCNDYFSCIWRHAGRVYATAPMLARPEYTSEWLLAQQKKAVTGTVSVALNGTVLTGTGTTFTGMRARPGDTLRLGLRGWQDAQKPVLLEILSVDSDTKITLAEPCPEAFNAADYAVHVGDNYHEQDSVDNNVSRFYGGLIRGAAGNGMTSAGVYGNIVTGTQIDFNFGFASKHGRRKSSLHHWSPLLYGAYIEGNWMGAFDLGNTIGFRVFGATDGSPPEYGPWMRVDGQLSVDDGGYNVRDAAGVGVGGRPALEYYSPGVPRAGTGITFPKVRIHEGVDLTSPAAYADRFPVGLSYLNVNGAAGTPPGAGGLGVVETFIHDGYNAPVDGKTDGIGFSWQRFYPRGGTSGTWIRYGDASGESGQPWGRWQKADGLLRPGMSGEAGDLNSAAYRPGKYPIGLSHQTINGALSGRPEGVGTQGMLLTYVDDVYGNPGPGEGFAWQMYLPVGPTDGYRAAIRFGLSTEAGTPWGAWQRMSYRPQAAPADSAPAAASAPTQAEYNALLAEVRELKSALKAAGVLT